VAQFFFDSQCISIVWNSGYAGLCFYKSVWYQYPVSRFLSAQLCALCFCQFFFWQIKDVGFLHWVRLQIVTPSYLPLLYWCCEKMPSCNLTKINLISWCENFFITAIIKLHWISLAHAAFIVCDLTTTDDNNCMCLQLCNVVFSNGKKMANNRNCNCIIYFRVVIRRHTLHKTFLHTTLVLK